MPHLKHFPADTPRRSGGRTRSTPKAPRASAGHTSARTGIAERESRVYFPSHIRKARLPRSADFPIVVCDQTIQSFLCSESKRRRRVDIFARRRGLICACARRLRKKNGANYFARADAIKVNQRDNGIPLFLIIHGYNPIRLRSPPPIISKNRL